MNPAELLALVRSHRPDLVIVDIRMPPTRTTEGLDAAQVIRRELPETAILVLSAHVEVEQATELLASGQRSGYLLKGRISDVEDFLATLDRILKGAAVVDPALVQELLAARRVDDPLQDLSPREREVLALMAEGRSNAGIAHQSVGHRGHGREARAQHPHEAAHPRGLRRPPARAGRAGLPRQPLMRPRCDLIRHRRKPDR